MTPAGNSSPVRTDQAGVHPDLERVVLRHLRTEWRKPLGRPTEEAWAAVAPFLAGGAPVELDSGCGTGLSSLGIARSAAASAPGTVVVGADRSLARLGALEGDCKVYTGHYAETTLEHERTFGHYLIPRKL